MIAAKRYHDISCGHRVVGHEGKCRHLHGHNYRIHVTVEATDGDTDDIGRVLDFSVIKSKICMWFEEHWDHKFLAWEEDPVMRALHSLAHDERVDFKITDAETKVFSDSIVWTPFNPTAENMAKFIVEVLGPQQLAGTGCRITCCEVEETAKCAAAYIRDF